MRKWYDKFAEWMVGIGIEPYIHVFVTMFIAWFIARVSLLTGADRMLAGYFAAFLAFVIGFVKEGWDSKVEKVFEGKDILSNLVGAVFFFLIWI